MKKAKVNLVFPKESETIRFTPDSNKTDSPEGETVEYWATVENTPEWLFCAAKAFGRWPIGKVLQRSEFLECLDKAGKVELV